jgi:hypothetical protein
VATPEPSLNREIGSDAAVAHGRVWVHALPFVLPGSMYPRVPGLQGTDNGMAGSVYVALTVDASSSHVSTANSLHGVQKSHAGVSSTQ